MSQNFSEGSARYTINFTISQQVKDAIEEDTLELESDEVLVRMNNLPDKI